MPLFLFGLMGDGSGGADVWIKPRLFHGCCCLPWLLFSEVAVEFAGVLALVLEGAGLVPGLPRAHVPRWQRGHPGLLASRVGEYSHCLLFLHGFCCQLCICTMSALSLPYLQGTEPPGGQCSHPLQLLERGEIPKKRSCFSFL